MAARKTYGQFCGLARALDHVGDRWTLLVVRELLLGPQHFADLVRALPGLATNLLVERLRTLEADGLVQRSPHPPRSRAVVYSLTERGSALEPAVLALIRWGASWMATGPGADQVDPRWAVLALRALLADDDVRSPRGRLVLDVEGELVTVDIGPAGRRVAGADAAPPRRVRATVRGPLPPVLGVAVGGLDLAAAALTVEGDTAFAAVALAPA